MSTCLQATTILKYLFPTTTFINVLITKYLCVSMYINFLRRRDKTRNELVDIFTSFA